MAGTQNSISSLVAQFLRLQRNSLEIINGLNEVAVSTNNTVRIEFLDENNLPQNQNIPSYGFLRGEIQRIDNNIKGLAGIGESSATVRNPDGTYSQVYKSEPLKEPARLTNLAVPSTFDVKDNWFFESFLTPLLYINVNVTGQVPDAADRMVVKRIIANTTTDAQKNYFDTSLKGRNDLSYNQFIQDLTDNGIGYFVDEAIEQLPLRTIRFIGGFSVTAFYDDEVTITDAAGNQFQETRRNYKLDKLTYTDTLSTFVDGRSLNNGDKISTQDGTQYQITSVDRDQSSIQAKRVSGYQPITIGDNNTLSISSTDFGPRYAQVNIGYNERQGIFFKAIDDNFNIVGAVWSTGIVFWSNELQTKNSSGTVVNLETYYLSEVSDLGKIFLGAAKENKVPAIEGLVPSSPTIAQTNFKVIQINKQVTDSTPIKVVNDKLSMKSSIKSEINQLDESINQSKLQLNTGLSSINEGSLQLTNISSSPILGDNVTPVSIVGQKTTPIGVNVQAVRANLSSLVQERVKKVELYASLVSEVKTLSVDVPQIITPPKYRVRGFWAFPSPQISPSTGAQEVIQFKVRYRYLSDSGSAQPNDQIEFLDNDGTRKNASFSNWTEYKTDIRKKVYDPRKGVYIWAPEDPSNSDVQNINQLDLAITKGEKVEIQIASISEAGWPDNPLTSDYSQSVIISFPDNLSVTGVDVALRTNTEDSAVTRMQAELNAQGLPTHLSEQFTVGDTTYYHNAVGIASGFYTNSGTVLNLFDKLTDLQNQLTLMKAELSNAKGVLQVYLVDSSNNKIKVSKGSTIKLNGGFYNEIFTSATTTDAGKIASISYNIQLFNAQASPVELASIIPGGLETAAPSSISSAFPAGYNTNLRYGDGPISLTALVTNDVESSTDFRQAPPYASSSAYSQYIYPRYRNIGFNQVLYYNPDLTDLGQYFSNSYSSSYTYNGVSSSTQNNFGLSGVYPQNGTIFTPYDPTLSASYATVIGGTAAAVWNGTFTGSTGGSPVGNGQLSEFCIHTGHPYLLSVGSTYSFTSYSELVKPYSSTSVSYAPFRHTQTFWGDISLPQYWVQQASRTPIDFATGATAAREDNMYADKLGFSSNDEYLVGKYSCGAYLYLGPVSNTPLQVPGTTSLSVTYLGEGETNSINIPVIFQFRAVDKLGYIGGWRKAGNLSNITYTKKIGIDIQIRNDDSFSFDIQVSGAYQNDTLVAPNFDSGVKSLNF
jgi:hypothetical protein